MKGRLQKQSPLFFALNRKLKTNYLHCMQIRWLLMYLPLIIEYRFTKTT